eukprot:CAMPEP_0204434598 /NCGR_PEP_ID=MMETSP0470-20130426/71872_1 /ASSEMBLY_ACC=CAM_ASM_000385 /TAXON_ID=2969 /ORGANISM="Oxyrrhis marina" /LENGTH=91 /DNA_ID=CAMNT_0051433089 /DNA_START=141 /DNA_END=413 /DNA_ORIENTATION=-
MASWQPSDITAIFTNHHNLIGDQGVGPAILAAALQAVRAVVAALRTHELHLGWGESLLQMLRALAARAMLHWCTPGLQCACRQISEIHNQR